MQQVFKEYSLTKQKQTEKINQKHTSTTQKEKKTNKHHTKRNRSKQNQYLQQQVALQLSLPLVKCNSDLLNFLDLRVHLTSYHHLKYFFQSQKARQLLFNSL